MQAREGWHTVIWRAKTVRWTLTQRAWRHVKKAVHAASTPPLNTMESLGLTSWNIQHVRAVLASEALEQLSWWWLNRATSEYPNAPRRISLSLSLPLPHSLTTTTDEGALLFWLVFPLIEKNILIMCQQKSWASLPWAQQEMNRPFLPIKKHSLYSKQLQGPPRANDAARQPSFH